MNKKILVLALFAPLIAMAASDKIPFPKNGVQVVSFEQMDIPESFKQDFYKRQKEMKEKGYIQSDSTYARDLFKTREEAPQEIKQFKSESNPYSGHYKANLSDIKLSFPFKELSIIKKEDILGYVPAGGYVKDKNIVKPYKEGWTGIGIFFNNGPKEVCVYTFFNLIASKGAVQMGKENTTYAVNHKPSYSAIEGNYNTGFVYSVTWNDKIGEHEVECADMLFDKEIMTKTLALANKIDSDTMQP